MSLLFTIYLTRWCLTITQTVANSGTSIKRGAERSTGIVHYNEVSLSVSLLFTIYLTRWCLTITQTVANSGTSIKRGVAGSTGIVHCNEVSLSVGQRKNFLQYPVFYCEKNGKNDLLAIASDTLFE